MFHLVTMKCSFLFLGAALATLATAAEQRTIYSQPSWVIHNSEVELAVTETGAQMAPVTFFRDSDKPVQPYHISPWQDEGLKLDVPVLVSLRGDWFCLPFGGNTDAFRGEQHPPHGEVAGGKWHLLESKNDSKSATLKVDLQTKVRPGHVTRAWSLLPGHNVIYGTDTIEGFAGPAPLGHHATLAMPDKEGTVRIATSPIKFGMTNPTQFSDPTKGEYQSFAIGARFTDLTKVPLQFKGAPDADVTRLPARQGFADLLQIYYEPGEIAWLTVTRGDEGWLWFSLKDPALMNSTVFWIENRGRHGAPWNGRNNCLGLEDVTAYFADGLPVSAEPNLLNKEGVKTAVELSKDHPTVIHYLQGVAKVPAGFEQVKTLEFAPGSVIFVSTSGQRVTVPVKHEFLKTGTLPTSN
jgi:hypothetical protein